MLLTDGEQAVLRRVKQGHTNRQIAGALGVTEATVSVHIKRIFLKLGIESRSQVQTVSIEQALLKETLKNPAFGAGRG